MVAAANRRDVHRAVSKPRAPGAVRRDLRPYILALRDVGEVLRPRSTGLDESAILRRDHGARGRAGERAGLLHVSGRPPLTPFRQEYGRPESAATFSGRARGTSARVAIERRHARSMRRDDWSRFAFHQ